MTDAAPPGAEQPVRGAVPRAELAAWRERFGLVAGLTTRGGDPPFNLGLSTDEPAVAVTGRWRAMRDVVRPAFASVHVAHQVHGTAIRWHREREAGWHIHDDHDAHATDAAGILLCVTIADCVPVYVTRRAGAVFALLHCGWRGTAAGLLEAGIAAVAGAAPGHAAVPPGQLAVHLGVGICGRCYEVGPEVVLAVTGEVVPGPVRFDLREALARRAAAAGITDLTTSPWCTSCHRDRFFSHRASAGRDGRMIAYLGRPAPSGASRSG